MWWKIIYFVSMVAAKAQKSSEVLITNFSSDDQEISSTSDDISTKYVNEYLHYIDTGIESEELLDVTQQILEAKNGTKRFARFPPTVTKNFFTCTMCRISAKFLIWSLRVTTSPSQTEAITKNAFAYLCSSLRIQTPQVCAGVFELNWPILYYIFRNSKANPQTICGNLPISFCHVEQPEFEIHLKIDPGKCALNAPKSQKPQKTSNDLNVLHLTDIHNDPEYGEGNLADCDEPLCCRPSSTGKMPSSNTSNAGYWGDYRNCDVPLYVVANALDHIREAHKKIDYLYLTGDIVAHNVWSTSKQSNEDIITNVYNLIEEKFKGIPIYPCVGNHESHPVNVFAPDIVPQQFQTTWLYEYLWHEWQRWLPPSTKETVIRGGYYTVAPKPGFRIISLNNVDCYILNWWMYYDANATSLPQLQWLHETLLSAEKNGEYVHILAHIASGTSDCWPVWAREYNRLVERFSHTISGIFNGHSHQDEFQVHYSAKGHAMAISWNAGSLTTHTMKNPNYRMYEVEPETYQVVDHSTWIFNLTEANGHEDRRSPNWYMEYHISQFTQNLSPGGIDALLEEMAANPNLLRQFWKYKVLSSDPQLKSGCNDDCLLETICAYATSKYNEKSRCKALQEKLKSSLRSKY